jgi:hypothetical protein
MDVAPWRLAGTRSLALVLVLVGGCAKRATSEETAPPIPECAAYVQAYGACLASMGGAPDEEDPRVASLRASLTPAPTDEAARERVRGECSANLQSLDQACR